MSSLFRNTYQHPAVINLAGEEVPILFKAMRRKTLKVQVLETGEIEVRLPLNCPKNYLQSFLEQHTPWLIERRQQVMGLLRQKQSQFMYLGASYEIVVAGTKGIWLSDDKIYLPERYRGKELEALDNWQKQQAREYFQELIDHWWPNFEHGAQINKPVLRVKKMKTRWGSLSQKGYINLNRLLMQYSPELIEMVVVHELCHSHYFDHSANFHRLMAKHLPNYRQLEKALNQASRDAYSF